MEAERLAASDRTLVPNRFVVHLNPDDLAGFADMEHSLASELADAALVFARAHHYTLVDRPQVDLLADAAVERTDIRVDARFADPIAGRTGAADDPEHAGMPGMPAGDPTHTLRLPGAAAVDPAARLRVRRRLGASAWSRSGPA